MTRHAGSRRAGILSEGKLRQQLHAPAELATSCFAHILRGCFHRMPRERLNRQLLIRFADPGLAEVCRQTEPGAAAGGADGCHDICAGDAIRRSALYAVADVHALGAEMFE